MRVLVASHTYIVDLNCEKFRTLARLEPDIEVTIVVPKRWRPGGVQKRLVETHAWQDDRFRVVPISNFSQNNQGILTFGWDLVRLLKEFQPHVMQVEQGSKGLAYAEMITLNRLLGLQAKMLFFTWWNLPYQLKFPVSALERYNLNGSDGIISGNQDGADILRDRGYHGPIRVMPQLGIDETLFRPQPQPALADSLTIAADDFVIGFVGRFVPEKGLLTLMQALGQLKEAAQSWKCLLLGRGPLKAELQQQAEALGISDRLRWVESVPHDDVPRYINLMSTLILPSETTYQFKTMTSVGWKEQFGHVLIEAMACQVPVIGSDSGEIPYVIGDAGLVFPEGDADSLSDRIRSLLESPDRQTHLSKRGYDLAMEKYTNRALAQQVLDFYRELLA
ncbi:hormogonium polysaccharide biosynthesis glycosyltransferase HpsO [Oscillatoria sp. CS-180]|uniref:hormogonium polysaccharide biosynthesis glycosyltransferase HpsO n=1 Tax=Oscillatoria sp. CS-180 TaxID=3021720 RepID=UPI002330960D|nr:hormogonium polysaccharide biosynthesis glycosyltransferase HpsO [Oscillatoria sp. CS-180]MDB9524440.1 hormogonium polysaccharide biosynthesis glycosyltransferase HpsO [Oscillatoria sp. CS-180]